MEVITQSQNQKLISYIVLCIKSFSKEFNMSFVEAYRYLENFGAIQFIVKHYEIEHTLSIDDAVEDMQAICRKNGGLI